MWQCAIHTPGLVTSSRMSTVSPVRIQHRVFPDQVGLGNAIAGEDQEAARPMYVEGVVHRVVPSHLVEQANLHPVADAESPVDRRGSRRRSSRSIELPADVGRRRHAVDLDHVVFPFDAVRRCVLVARGRALRVLVAFVVAAAGLGDELRPAAASCRTPGNGPARR